MMTCDRAVLINKGRVLADSSVSSLAQGSGGNLEQAYLKIISQDAHAV
jgi:ABC-type Na+ transport system ATPase subunit NatA